MLFVFSFSVCLSDISLDFFHFDFLAALLFSCLASLMPSVNQSVFGLIVTSLVVAGACLSSICTRVVLQLWIRSSRSVVVFVNEVLRLISETNSSMSMLFIYLTVILFFLHMGFMGGGHCKVLDQLNIRCTSY